MAQIHWDQDAETIHNQIRAFSPHPGAWTQVEINGQIKRMKILRSEVVEGKGETGASILFSKKKWIVACGKQALSLKEVQLEGKKKLTFSNFISGINYPIKIK